MGGKPKVITEEPPQMEAPAIEPLVVERPIQEKKTRGSFQSGSPVGGLVLIIVGVLFLAENFIPRFHLFDYWPLILIAVGAGLLWKALGR